MTTIPSLGAATAMSGTAPQKLAYSVSEACALCGLSRSFVYLEWRAGRGPARIKIGSRTLIRAEALDTWLKAQEFAGQ